MTGGERGGPAAVSAAVYRELAAQASADLWLVFDRRADLRAKSRVAGWAERGEAVVEALRATAERAQAETVELLEATGAEYQTFWVANRVFVESADAALVERLRDVLQVARIEDNPPLPTPDPAPGEPIATQSAVEWGVEAIGAPAVWNEFGVRGEGIVVANIDTVVVHDHPALAGAYRGNLRRGRFDHDYNWFDPGRLCPSSEPCDTNGSSHGTHTMGTMVGDDGGDYQVGVAPGAEWVAALGCCPSRVELLESAQWILEPTDLNGANPRPDLRPHVVSNSWGAATGANRDPWFDEVLQAWTAAGTFSAFAIGNSGPDCRTAGSPGDSPFAFGVGAFAEDGSIAAFSSRGPNQGDVKPDIAAPGVNVRSSQGRNGYGSLDGTSMAAPHVAGAVALIWSAQPDLVGEVDATIDLLERTAIDQTQRTCGGSPDENNTWGEGKLDIFQAVQEAGLPDSGIEGTVTDATTGQPVGQTSVSFSAVDRETLTSAGGTYRRHLEPGTYTLEVSAFGYQPAIREGVPVVDGQFTVEDLTLAPLPTGMVTGTAALDSRDVSVPGLAVRLADAPPELSAVTGPDGSYTIPDVPVGTGALLVDHRALAHPPVEVTVTDGQATTVDIALQLSDTVAIVDTVAHAQNEYGRFLFEPNGIDWDLYTWPELTQTVWHKTVVLGWGTADSHDPDDFQAFLDATDANGTGVIFTVGQAGGTSLPALHRLSLHTGQPATVQTVPPIAELPYFEVRAEHELLASFQVGDRLEAPIGTGLIPGTWFDGYEGEGRQILADTGRGDEVFGGGIAVDERPGNRHVLASLHVAFDFNFNPLPPAEEIAEFFLNAVAWVSSPATSGEPVVAVPGSPYEAN